VTVWRCTIPGFGVVTSDSVCERCPAGTYSMRGEICLACPAGWSSAQIGATACTLCPAGTYSMAGGICLSCPAGSYSAQIGATGCTLCPAGTFSLNPSQILVSSCVSCPAGSTSNATRTGCVANAGFYNLDSNLLAHYPFRPENVYLDASYTGYGLTDTNG
jgi:hypothetical protein